MSQADKTTVSKHLTQTIAAQRKTIKYNEKYILEQEELIDKIINDGHNYISQLTREADDINEAIAESKTELISLCARIDDKRYELLGLE